MLGRRDPLDPAPQSFFAMSDHTDTDDDIEGYVPRNGSPVNWRELNLALRPILLAQTRFDAVLSAIDGKVDSLIEKDVLEKGREEGRSLERQGFLHTRRFWLTTAVGLMAVVVPAIVTVIALKMSAKP